MKTKRDVAALCIADVHLSLKPPVARSCEEDWLDVMAGYLDQLSEIQRTCNPEGSKPPILVAGDLFDKSSAPSELTNWAIRNMPNCYAVPGQHDLPNHSWKRRKHSAFWSLVEAGRVTPLLPGKPVGTGCLQLWGYPWSFPVKPCPKPHDLCLDVAVVHDYVWIKHKGYDGAPREKRLAIRRPQMEGYRIVVIGDNHTPWEIVGSNHQTKVVNCGAFIRRKADEQKHKPSVVLLREDGTVERKYLDVSKDKFLDDRRLERLVASEASTAVKGFAESLLRLTDAAEDYSEAVRRAVEQEAASESVRAIMFQALEDAKQ